MMNHKRILVALSLSDGRDAAFNRALSLAKASGSELYLLHAVPADQPFSYRAAERLRRAKEFRQRAEAAGVSAQTVEQHGDPAGIIVLHADARPVDLIVMGTARRTGWARLRQRSVEEWVLRRTTRPTLIVRGDDTGEGPDFENVVVAVDLSPTSTALIDKALRLPGADQRQLTVVHAVTGTEAAEAVRHRAAWVLPEYPGNLLVGADRRLAEVVPPRIRTKVTMRVAGGRAAGIIRTYARDANADLIVTGRTRRFMNPGSIAVRLLRTTDRAVLIIPPEALAQNTDVGRSVYNRAA
jgi:nucleotide-binding universal stress UspA family protein